MSAANFSTPRATRVFAFGKNRYIDQETIDANEIDQDQLGQYDEFLTQDCADEAIDYCKSLIEANDGWEDDGHDGDLTIIGCMEIHTEFAGMDLTVRIKAGYESGYYEAAMFDFTEPHIIMECDGFTEELDTDDAEDIDLNILTDIMDNPGMAKMQLRNVQNKVQGMIDELTGKMNTIFSISCEDEVFKAYQFSNGEAGYGKYKDRFSESWGEKIKFPA